MTSLNSSLALRSLWLLGVYLPTESDSEQVPASALSASAEYGVAAAGEIPWLRAWLSRWQWHFLTRIVRLTPTPRAADSLETHEISTEDTGFLSVRSVNFAEQNNDDDDNSRAEISWRFSPGENKIFLDTADPVNVRGEVSLAFADLPEDAREAAAYGYAAELALTLTGSRSLSDTLLKRADSRIDALRRRDRIRRLQSAPPLRAEAGDFVRALGRASAGR